MFTRKIKNIFILCSFICMSLSGCTHHVDIVNHQRFRPSPRNAIGSINAPLLLGGFVVGVIVVFDSGSNLYPHTKKHNIPIHHINNLYEM